MIAGVCGVASFVCTNAMVVAARATEMNRPWSERPQAMPRRRERSQDECAVRHRRARAWTERAITVGRFDILIVPLSPSRTSQALYVGDATFVARKTMSSRPKRKGPFAPP